MLNTHRQSLPAFLILLVLLSSACAPSSSGTNTATQTAQSLRGVQMATQAAERVQATNQVRFAYVTATAEAFESLLEAARLWPVVFEDTFDEELGDWPIGQNEGELAEITWRISDGKYQWDANANSGFVWWALPESQEVSDFFLAADMLLVSGPQDAEAGLVFRSDAEISYYNLSITNEGNFSVYLHSPDGWEPLQDWIPSRHILPGEVNRLAVIAKDERVLVFINDHFQVELTDTILQEGQAGLIIGLSYGGEEGNWEFDNFELRAPHASQIGAAKPDQVVNNP